MVGTGRCGVYVLHRRALRLGNGNDLLVGLDVENDEVSTLNRASFLRGPGQAEQPGVALNPPRVDRIEIVSLLLARMLLLIGVSQYSAG